MDILESVLALIGLLALVGGAAWSCFKRPPAPSVGEDVAAPYREALHAAVRMQRVAQDLEAQMYAEAASFGGSAEKVADHQDASS